MRASAETMDVIQGYYALMDAGDLHACERYFAPDATMQIAHFPKLEGWPMIERVMGSGLANPNVAKLTHEVRNAWDEDNCSIFEVHAHYEMTDGRAIVVPGVVIAEIRDGRFTSQRIAADLSPTFAP